MLIPKGVLGYSNTAVVEKVRCKRIMLARKKIRCNWRVKREEMIEEVAHLQRLSHAHVVRVVGTYVIGNELSILLYPATTHNLETFMNEYTELRDQPRSSFSLASLISMETALIRFIRCLASTIAYVHANLIKHMDIKPTNLLVQEKISETGLTTRSTLRTLGSHDHIEPCSMWRQILPRHSAGLMQRQKSLARILGGFLLIYSVLDVSSSR
jgi:serine/threonine protein kinase